MIIISLLSSLWFYFLFYTIRSSYPSFYSFLLNSAVQWTVLTRPAVQARAERSHGSTLHSSQPISSVNILPFQPLILTYLIFFVSLFFFFSLSLFLCYILGLQVLTVGSIRRQSTQLSAQIHRYHSHTQNNLHTPYKFVIKVLMSKFLLECVSITLYYI